MYIPTQFAWTDTVSILSFCRAHPFATLLACRHDGAQAQHLPVLTEVIDGRFVLHAHAALANPILSSDRLLVIFHGPHAFIDAAWYQEPGTVPTWNYLAVHMYGKLTKVQDPNRVRELFTALAIANGDDGKQWSGRLDTETYQRLSAAIGWFRIDVDLVEGKAKLSQHHSTARRELTVGALKASASEGERTIGEAMARTLAGEPPWEPS
jgi:transcriptional regulator